MRGNSRIRMTEIHETTECAETTERTKTTKSWEQSNPRK